MDDTVIVPGPRVLVEEREADYAYINPSEIISTASTAASNN